MNFYSWDMIIAAKKKKNLIYLDVHYLLSKNFYYFVARKSKKGLVWYWFKHEVVMFLISLLERLSKSTLSKYVYSLQIFEARARELLTDFLIFPASGHRMVYSIRRSPNFGTIIVHGHHVLQFSYQKTDPNQHLEHFFYILIRQSTFMSSIAAVTTLVIRISYYLFRTSWFSLSIFNRRV